LLVLVDGACDFKSNPGFASSYFDGHLAITPLGST